MFSKPKKAEIIITSQIILGTGHSRLPKCIKQNFYFFRFTERKKTTPVRKQISWAVSGKHIILMTLKFFSRSLQKQGAFKYLFLWQMSFMLTFEA